MEQKTGLGPLQVTKTLSAQSGWATVTVVNRPLVLSASMGSCTITPGSGAQTAALHATSFSHPTADALTVSLLPSCPEGGGGSSGWEAVCVLGSADDEAPPEGEKEDLAAQFVARLEYVDGQGVRQQEDVEAALAWSSQGGTLATATFALPCLDVEYGAVPTFTLELASRNNSSSDSDSDSDSAVGIVIGGVVGGLAVCGAAAGAFLIRRRNAARKHFSPTTSKSTSLYPNPSRDAGSQPPPSPRPSRPAPPPPPRPTVELETVNTV
eukprot:GCRY01005269.1.p1 GENE.GCRY01005269.1~~GCRY01005269.1.p1  ORF type:complete len:267 (-),score=88.37 GCRY01005269.1:280-1080(-)